MFDEFKNAFQKPNNTHVQLIIINVVVFLLMAVIKVFSTASGFADVFELIHAQVSIPAPFFSFLRKPWTIITYAFVHDLSGIFHILFNMLVFYWFAKLFIEYLGSDKLVALYVLGAIAGGVSYLLVYNTIPFYEALTPANGMVGASAAVYAVLVATAVLLPDYTFFLLFLGPIKIKYIALFYIVISFLGTIGGNAGGNIAHLGGALIGFIYIKQLQAGVNWGGWITTLLDSFKGLFGSQPNVKVTYRKAEPKVHQPTTKTTKANKASQDEIDSILDKISDRGYESLSKEEKEKLFNASKK
ncbi:MAG: rhomboid family intramembrane serine protease [Cyclobacteriaceae bacterium]|nr:rhomboid family intramembrane serine protease [Cyclobacteriaceae bacterium]